MLKPHLWLLIILLNPQAAFADAPDILIMGLFRDQVMLEINQQQRLLRLNETSPEGVTLLRADSDSALLEINGQQQRFELGSRIGGPLSAPQLATVSVWPSDGMYLTTGNINGFTVDFLIDTGASAIALNAATARRLGIDYLNAPTITVRTASGIEQAYRVTLGVVQLGDIRRFNVNAMVIDGPEPERALLGMSFLESLEIRRQGERLDLLEQY